MAINGLYKDEEKHIYYINGEKKDCVSDILGLIDGVMLKGIPLYNLKIAADRGKRIHEATEQYDYERDLFDWEEFSEENADIVPYIIAYANFIKDYPSFPIAREEPFYNDIDDYACTVDLGKYINGRFALIDIKSAQKTSMLRLRYQLTKYAKAYCCATNSQMPDLYCLHLKDNGEYQLIPIEQIDLTNILQLWKQIKEDKQIG